MIFKTLEIDKILNEDGNTTATQHETLPNAAQRYGPLVMTSVVAALMSTHVTPVSTAFNFCTPD